MKDLLQDTWIYQNMFRPEYIKNFVLFMSFFIAYLVAISLALLAIAAQTRKLPHGGSISNSKIENLDAPAHLKG